MPLKWCGVLASLPFFAFELTKEQSVGYCTSPRPYDHQNATVVDGISETHL